MKKDINQKINLLFLLQTFRTGGSERIVKDLCENLDRQKFSCFVLALVGGEMEKEFRESGIPTHCVHKKGRDAFKVMQEIAQFVKANHIGVINAHHFSPFIHGFYGAKMNRSKIVFTAHTCAEVDVINRFWTALGIVLLRFSDGAIGISHEVIDSMLKKFHLRGTKAFTIINAVNHKRFEITVDRKQKMKEIGLLDGDKVIGSVGSLGRQKNYPNLIRAFSILLRNINDVKLLIIGDGRRRDELIGLVRSLGLDGKVLLPGARLDVPELMKIMDVYCLASFYEGLPLTVLEAMAAGLPVVATDVIGIKEVVTHEKTGLLVPPDDPEELAMALFRVLTCPALATELAGNGRRYANEKHAMAKWIEEYDNLFSQQGNL